MTPIRWPNVGPIRSDESLRGRGAKGLRIAVRAEFERNLVPRLPFLAAEGGPPRAPKSRGRLGYSSEKDIFERKFAHPIAKRTWMGEKMADIKGQNRGSADITSIQAFRGPGLRLQRNRQASFQNESTRTKIHTKSPVLGTVSTFSPGCASLSLPTLSDELRRM